MNKTKIFIIAGQIIAGLTTVVLGVVKNKIDIDEAVEKQLQKNDDTENSDEEEV